MIIKENLTDAMAVARSRPNLTVWLVLSLEGAVYFVFFSRADATGVANANARNRLALNAEIISRFQNPPNPPIPPTQQQWIAVQPYAQRALDQYLTGRDREGRHAEESMIEHWSECVREFKARRGRAPARADVFLSHSPCFKEHGTPSPARFLNNHSYPVSCEEKLKFFVSSQHGSMKWTIYYENAFGGRSPAAADLTTKHLRIMRRPNYIHLP